MTTLTQSVFLRQQKYTIVVICTAYSWNYLETPTTKSLFMISVPYTVYMHKSLKTEDVKERNKFAL